MAKIILIDDKYYFDAEDGSEAIECPTWLETSKKNATHPDGKLWIKLPKHNITNRQYFSVDLFNETNVDGAVTVEVKVGGPRVLGTSTVRKEVYTYLDAEQAAELEAIVNRGVEAYKAAKSTSKAKKLEDMTEEELLAFIEAKKAGVKVTKVMDGPKSFIDALSEEDAARYTELIAISMENKQNRPKAVRGPLTDEEKAVRAEKRRAKDISKAEALLAALKAKLAEVPAEEDIIDED